MHGVKGQNRGIWCCPSKIFDFNALLCVFRSFLSMFLIFNHFFSHVFLFYFSFRSSPHPLATSMLSVVSIIIFSSPFYLLLFICSSLTIPPLLLPIIPSPPPQNDAIPSRCSQSLRAVPNGHTDLLNCS